MLALRVVNASLVNARVVTARMVTASLVNARVPVILGGSFTSQIEMGQTLI